MNTSKIKSTIIAYLIAGSIIFNYALPVFTTGTSPKMEVIQQKPDSKKVSPDKSKTQNSQVDTEEVKDAKTTTNLAYNFIYYLISKFIQVNPLYRSR